MILKPFFLPTAISYFFLLCLWTQFDDLILFILRVIKTESNYNFMIRPFHNELMGDDVWVYQDKNESFLIRGFVNGKLGFSIWE